MTRAITTRLLLFACLLLLAYVPIQAQTLSSGAQTIALTAALDESISINVTSNQVNFNLTQRSASNPGDTGVLATTTWMTKPGRTVTTYIFFTTSAVALTDGAGDNIPSSSFEVSDNFGAFKPLTNTVVFGGAAAGLQLTSTKITGQNRRGFHLDFMRFNIDLSSITLPAGNYAGTVTLRAEAN